MTNVDPDWSGNTFTVGSLATGMSTTVDVDLVIGSTFQGPILVNNAEITEATNALGIEDEDGAIGTINGGVAGDESELDTDGDINDDGAGTPGTADNTADADDYDPAQINVAQTFDLALTKTISSMGPFAPGDTVKYTITVYNQGTLHADSIVVTETPPVGTVSYTHLTLPTKA